MSNKNILLKHESGAHLCINLDSTTVYYLINFTIISPSLFIKKIVKI